jgi:hypothetical protein
LLLVHAAAPVAALNDKLPKAAQIPCADHSISNVNKTFWQIAPAAWRVLLALIAQATGKNRLPDEFQGSIRQMRGNKWGAKVKTLYLNRFTG